MHTTHLWNKIVANAKAAIDKAVELGVTDPNRVGIGGIVRLVMLPYESHGYTARECTEHVLYEMISWFDKYVKNAKQDFNR